MALFTITDQQDVPPHSYIRLIPADEASLPDELASRVRDTYVNVETELQRLRDAATELIVFDASGLAPGDAEIDEALAELCDALLPAPWDGRRLKHTDVQRGSLVRSQPRPLEKPLQAARLSSNRVGHRDVCALAQAA
jgi:hypothetical protein